MKRPRQHVIDSLGEAQIRSVFEPLGWTVNKIQPDYGVDFEVEVFRGSESTGIMFKVQLKSSCATKYLLHGDFVSERLETANLVRLTEELCTPVILIHSDVKDGRTFWLAPQLDDTLGGLARTNPKTLTLRVPTSNELPRTIDELINTVGRVAQLLATRLVVATPIKEFVSVHEHVDADELLTAFKNKGDAIRLMKAQSLLLEGSLDAARDEIRKVINDPESSIEIKFWAVLWAERIELIDLGRANTTHHWPSVRLSVSDQLWKLSKKGPPHLKLFALIARRAAELEYLVTLDWGLYLNWKRNEKRGDQLWKIQLGIELAGSYRRVLKKYNQCIRLVQYGLRSAHRWALPLAFVRIVFAIHPCILRFARESNRDIADRYSSSAFELCKLATAIAREVDDFDAMALCISAALPTKRDPNSEVWRWAEDAIRTIKDVRAQENAQRLFDDHSRRIRGEQLKGDIKTTARQIYEHMAAALGIDLANPNDPLADIVRIGLEDLDPSRVLRNCEHIFITLGAQIPIVAPLGLPTAGDKVIHCDLHKYAAEGLVLDETFAFFKERYCDSCLDCSPRPPTWAYSEAWQREENARHIEFMRDFDKRTGTVTSDRFE